MRFPPQQRDRDEFVGIVMLAPSAQQARWKGGEGKWRFPGSTNSSDIHFDGCWYSWSKDVGFISFAWYLLNHTRLPWRLHICSMDLANVCGNIIPVHQAKEVVQGEVFPANRWPSKPSLLRSTHYPRIMEVEKWFPPRLVSTTMILGKVGAWRKIITHNYVAM